MFCNLSFHSGQVDTSCERPKLSLANEIVLDEQRNEMAEVRTLIRSSHPENFGLPHKQALEVCPFFIAFSDSLLAADHFFGDEFSGISEEMI